MSVIAHFTPTEIPGTLAVLLLGLSIGALVFSRRAASSLMIVVCCSLAVFAFLGYSGDVRDWSEGIRLAIDAIFLAHAVLLWALALRAPERS